MLKLELICRTAFHHNMMDKEADSIRALDNGFYLGEGSEYNFLVTNFLVTVYPLALTSHRSWSMLGYLLWCWCLGVAQQRSGPLRGAELCNKNSGMGWAQGLRGYGAMEHECWSPRLAQEPGSSILSGTKNEKANCQAAQAVLLYSMERNLMNMYGIFSPWNVRGRVCHWSEVRIHCGLMDLCA